MARSNNVKSGKDVSMVIANEDGRKTNRNLNYYFHTEEQIIEALIANGGLITPSAKALGVAQNSLSLRINRNPSLKKILNDCREINKDLAESIIFNGMTNGSTEQIRIDCAKYYLNAVGRDRGYGNLTTNINYNANMNLNADFDLSKLSLEEMEKLYDIRRKITNESEDDVTIIDAN